MINNCKRKNANTPIIYGLKFSNRKAPVSYSSHKKISSIGYDMRRFHIWIRWRSKVFPYLIYGSFLVSVISLIGWEFHFNLILPSYVSLLSFLGFITILLGVTCKCGTSRAIQHGKRIA